MESKPLVLCLIMHGRTRVLQGFFRLLLLHVSDILYTDGCERVRTVVSKLQICNGIPVWTISEWHDAVGGLSFLLKLVCSRNLLSSITDLLQLIDLGVKFLSTSSRAVQLRIGLVHLAEVSHSKWVT